MTELYKEFIADAYFPYVDFRQWDSIKIADYMDENIPYERNIYVRKRMKYEAWVSFIAGVMILIPILMFFIPG